MNPTVQIILAALFVIWLFASPDALADVIRVRLFHMRSVVIRKLDSAVARQEAAVAAAELAKSRSETHLLELKTARNLALEQLKPFDDEISTMDRAAKRAGKLGDEASVKEAVEKMQTAQEDSAEIRTRYEAADARVKKLDIDIDALDTEIKVRKSKLAEARSRAASASSGKEIYRIIADLDEAGSQRNQQKAEEILQNAEAEAKTYEDEANLKIARRRADAKLRALGTEVETPSASDLVAKYMGTSEAK
ncbi:hypothetical protein HYV64_03570 [Candidatus Shapirobacteria bacterium]|nr:hypothetical protein [Candidatus Shapirobacteria bacterium]